MVRYSVSSHNSSKMRQKSVQWYPLSAFLFSLPLCSGVSEAKHMVLTLKKVSIVTLRRLKGTIGYVFLRKNVPLGSELISLSSVRLLGVIF